MQQQAKQTFRQRKRQDYNEGSAQNHKSCEGTRAIQMSRLAKVKNQRAVNKLTETGEQRRTKALTKRQD